ncbi:hypothetical protein P3X46_016202 [Hevea brasiliensis]|uniref:Uncharacterized protein n=1 Tax=Hevea brasiliensis TaxID=3981 RepID=A0ABQ9LYC6_HEVBR|nr:uncharacterized protein LOC110661166 [Hevea brasiliensis]KAJ9173026.1 hypothetical protein P3X46_016202 [Hevea brasiliensis]
MASSPASCSTPIKPSSLKLISSTRQAFQVRAQSFRDEGSWSEANLRVLRERIQEIKMKERLERCCRCEFGWNYSPGYNYKLKKQGGLSQVFDLVGLVCRTIGFSCVTGTLILVIVSLIIHLNQ